MVVVVVVVVIVIIIIIIVIIISDCICSYSGVSNFEPQRRDGLF